MAGGGCTHRCPAALRRRRLQAIQRSDTRIIQSAIDVKFWARVPPSCPAVRPASCPGCGPASREPGKALRVVGHGLRSREVEGPEEPGGGASVEDGAGAAVSVPRVRGGAGGRPARSGACAPVNARRHWLCAGPSREASSPTGDGARPQVLGADDRALVTTSTSTAGSTRSDHGGGVIWTRRELTEQQRALLLDIRREQPRATASLIVRTLVLEGRLSKGVVSVSTVRRLYKQQGLDRVRLDAADGRIRLRWQADRADAIWHSDVCHGPALRIGGRSFPLRIHALLDDTAGTSLRFRPPRRSVKWRCSRSW